MEEHGINLLIEFRDNVLRAIEQNRFNPTPVDGLYGTPNTSTLTKTNGEIVEIDCVKVFDNWQNCTDFNGLNFITFRGVNFAFHDDHFSGIKISSNEWCFFDQNTAYRHFFEDDIDSSNLIAALTEAGLI